MHKTITPQNLQAHGIDHEHSRELAIKINAYINKYKGQACWQHLLTDVLPRINDIKLLRLLYHTVYPDWKHEPAVAWLPSDATIKQSNIYRALQELNISDYSKLHEFSYQNQQKFWDYTFNKLNIKFNTAYQQLVDLSNGVENADWLPGANFNITESIFNGDANAIAIIQQAEEGALNTMTYGELDSLSNRIANSLKEFGFAVGDAIAIYMPMHANACAIYLGVIKAGLIAVPIAESFAPKEIQTRVSIGKAKAIFCQDYLLRNRKHLPLYEKIIAAKCPQAIVLPCVDDQYDKQLRTGDFKFSDFLIADDDFKPYSAAADDIMTILFSSGTTGDPKAIPWFHYTAIKPASDSYYHHDLKPGERFCWPTSLGWMMGPWLLFATLINKATIVLYDGLPQSTGFGEFVAKAKVNLLGVVPTLVKSWRESACMEQFDWGQIKLFTSTGECSNVDDMFYLMSLAGIKPVIEYCGGTEIAGSYLTSTIMTGNAPGTFTTPTLGLNIIILDEHGKPTNNGEIAIMAPAFGLSTKLLNRDHYKIYYHAMPKGPNGEILRRHGDQIEKINQQFYRAHGRIDDTMNLGGIKTSSAELERVLDKLGPVYETAAIAIKPNHGGPQQLVIYVVPAASHYDISQTVLKTLMQQTIKQELNPLFKIHDIVFVTELPRTASNKIMRRVLREKYQQPTKQNKE